VFGGDGETVRQLFQLLAFASMASAG
jgi:hypothetical protein